MYLPTSGTMLPKTSFVNGVPTANDGLPHFCSKSTRSCSLILGNSEGQLSATDRRWFTDDQIDQIIYSWPTVDLMIPSDWKGQLVINNNDKSSAKFAHRTVIVPFNGDFFDSFYLYSTLSSGIVLPSLSLNAQSASYPILFNGVRGGLFNSVSMNSVSGGFIARGATFAPNSVVSINIPMGDIVISANQKILTTVKSIYAATPPAVSTVTRPTVTIGQSPTQLIISLGGRNFRNLATGDLNLIVPNGTCTPPQSLPGLAAIEQSISFTCDFSNGIKSTGSVSEPLLLSYFGGNLLSIGYTLRFATSFGQSTTIHSPTIVPNANPRISSGLGCDAESIAPNLPPGNVCAVAAASSQQQNVPQFTASNADTVVEMLPASRNPTPNSFRFESSAARSITLGSYQYSIGAPLSDYAAPQQTPSARYSTQIKSVRSCARAGCCCIVRLVLSCVEQIAACPVVYDPQNPVTLGRIASRNPNFNIPYEEQQNLLNAVKLLSQGNASFVIIKVNGGGANLPGFRSRASAWCMCKNSDYLQDTLP